MPSRRGQVITIAILAVFAVLIIVAIATPNLMRSRIAADEASFYGRMRSASGDEAPGQEKMSAKLARVESPASDFIANHKVIRTAKLELRVEDVRRAVDDLRTATARSGGYVEHAEFSDSGSGYLNAIVTVRVPEAKLESALASFKQSSVRVERETLESRDVTKEFVDTEARLRNLRAEEAQYLTILKRASTVKDTLEVSEKLGDVRGEIESMQGQLDYLSHEVEMSTITVGLRPQVPVTVAALEWHPLVKARLAFREMLAGLADYADTMVAILVNVPLILVWVGTVGTALFGLWRLLRWMRPRLFTAKPGATA